MEDQLQPWCGACKSTALTYNQENVRNENIQLENSKQKQFQTARTGMESNHTEHVQQLPSPSSNVCWCKQCFLEQQIQGQFLKKMESRYSEGQENCQCRDKGASDSQEETTEEEFHGLGCLAITWCERTYQFHHSQSRCHGKHHQFCHQD